nr:hypothetical protein Iba_chr11bCG9930 [Ipomoea batatas]
MVSNKSFSLIFSLLLITAFLCFTTTNATSRRLYAAVEGLSSNQLVFHHGNRKCSNE